jgi:hypothetical protein
MNKCNHPDFDICPSNGRDYHERCLGVCQECGDHLLSTGRYTVYCPACDVCGECGCANADGFAHYAGCNDNGNGPS